MKTYTEEYQEEWEEQTPVILPKKHILTQDQKVLIIANVMSGAATEHVFDPAAIKYRVKECLAIASEILFESY